MHFRDEPTLVTMVIGVLTFSSVFPRAPLARPIRARYRFNLYLQGFNIYY